MKKLAISLAVGAALAFTPLSSFALTAMSDATMKDATGQAGVTIVVDEIVMYQTVGETMYIDGDGATDDLATSAAGVSISGKATFTTMRALQDGGNREGFLKDAFTGEGYGQLLNGTEFAGTGPDALNTADFLNGVDGDTVSWVGERVGTDLEGDTRYSIELSGIDIDVASNALVLTKINKEDTAAVVIGIPTIEICKTGDTQTIGIWACDYEGNKTDNGGDLIQITKTDSVMTVLGGILEIAAH